MAVAGIAAVDLYTALRANRSREHGMRERRMNLHAAITINRPREEVYLYWRDFEKLPRFMTHLESVETIGDGHSRWKARAPLKRTVEWEAEIVEDCSGELISWRSTKGVLAGNRGFVSFSDAPGGRGTEVRVRLIYDPPGGRAPRPRQAAGRAPRAAGARRPAPVQAGHGDRRGGPFRGQPRGHPCVAPGQAASRPAREVRRIP
ncbi:SRPBCC family protein [Streptosporangium lutulentum]